MWASSAKLGKVASKLTLCTYLPDIFQDFVTKLTLIPPIF